MYVQFSFFINAIIYNFFPIPLFFFPFSLFFKSLSFEWTKVACSNAILESRGLRSPTVIRFEWKILGVWELPAANEGKLEKVEEKKKKIPHWRGKVNPNDWHHGCEQMPIDCLILTPFYDHHRPPPPECILCTFHTLIVYTTTGSPSCHTQASFTIIYCSCFNIHHIFKKDLPRYIHRFNKLIKFILNKYLKFNNFYIDSKEITKSSLRFNHRFLIIDLLFSFFYLIEFLSYILYRNP